MRFCNRCWIVWEWPARSSAQSALVLYVLRLGNGGANSVWSAASHVWRGHARPPMFCGSENSQPRPGGAAYCELAWPVKPSTERAQGSQER